METQKHTVTIPISDYNELIEAKSMLENSIAVKHLEMLVDRNIATNLNLQKEPVDVVIHSGLHYGAAAISFRYNENK